ncbi:MAG TPA: PilT/PilU family type 4a pilus ATPase [Candidatus Saccharimonadia bacterium]|nr:PilT/PilU family type 4a pilus ATPase [Candidatus Saccharimonadia bacterium]
MPQHDLVDYLLLARQQGASDLHITARAQPSMRVFGALQPLTDEILTGDDTRELIYGVLRDSQRVRLEQDWELDFSMEVESAGRLRANARYALGCVEASFRFIPDEVPDLTTLGHSPTVERWCQEKSGLVLVTGSSGSGKSHTLASMTQTIARQRCANIVSIEDPVEFVFQQGYSLIHQREVGADTHSFAAALRSSLRQDPDVIILGEMRDEETIRIALTAASTGHLVIATLHTTDTGAAITRVLDAFPEERQRFVAAQLAATLQGVVCQFLLPRHDTPGLVMASEIMVVNTAIANCIRERRLSQLMGLIQIGAGDGMHTIDDSLLELVLGDRITFPDAASHCSDVSYFQQQYQQALKEKKKSWFGKLLGG